MPKNKIFKKSDGRYSYNVSDSSGNRISIASHKNEKLQDFKKRCDAIDTIAVGEYHLDSMDELFNTWMKLHVIPNLSKSYAKGCNDAYYKFVSPAIGKKRISDIKRIDVYNILAAANENGYAASSIKKIRTTISAPYNFAINSLGYNIISPAQGLVFKYKKNKAIYRKRVLTPDELQRVLESAKNSKYYNYFRILSLTGMRPSECLGLKLSDIKNDYLEINRAITNDGLSNLKTDGSKRKIPIYPALQIVLQEQKAAVLFQSPDKWMFPSENGKPSLNAVKIALKRILKGTAIYERGGRNGLKKLKLITPAVNCSLYDFRHTFATRMAEDNMPHLTLQKILGHKDIATTLKYYVDFTEKMERDAIVQMEKLA